MLNIHKNYVLDENQQPIAVQIPIAEFQKIEEILEYYGLAKLMEETEDEERLSKEEALRYADCSPQGNLQNFYLKCDRATFIVGLQKQGTR